MFDRSSFSLRSIGLGGLPRSVTYRNNFDWLRMPSWPMPCLGWFRKRATDLPRSFKELFATSKICYYLSVPQLFVRVSSLFSIASSISVPWLIWLCWPLPFWSCGRKRDSLKLKIQKPILSIYHLPFLPGSTWILGWLESLFFKNFEFWSYRHSEIEVKREKNNCKKVVFIQKVEGERTRVFNLTKRKGFGCCACFACSYLTSRCNQYPAESTWTYERWLFGLWSQMAWELRDWLYPQKNICLGSILAVPLFSWLRFQEWKMEAALENEADICQTSLLKRRSLDLADVGIVHWKQSKGCAALTAKVERVKDDS